jgi:ABC-type nitrate/sulfonate/bicarbonate transport system permease component
VSPYDVLHGFVTAAAAGVLVGLVTIFVSLMSK